MPAKFQEYTFGHLFGEVWQDETLSLAERELVTCTTLVALNRIAEQHLHFVGASNAGVPREKIEAMIGPRRPLRRLALRRLRVHGAQRGLAGVAASAAPEASARRVRRRCGG